MPTKLGMLNYTGSSSYKNKVLILGIKRSEYTQIISESKLHISIADSKKIQEYIL
jgi:hypothetical protein